MSIAVGLYMVDLSLDYRSRVSGNQLHSTCKRITTHVSLVLLRPGWGNPQLKWFNFMLRYLGKRCPALCSRQCFYVTVRLKHLQYRIQAHGDLRLAIYLRISLLRTKSCGKPNLIVECEIRKISRVLGLQLSSSIWYLSSNKNAGKTAVCSNGHELTSCQLSEHKYTQLHQNAIWYFLRVQWSAW